jgi:hypothetical protein
MNFKASNVIILGCGRSGTSIFGELFQQLLNYTYLSEPLYEELLKLNYKNPIAVKVPRESPGYPPDSGLSFPLSQYFEVLPGSKTVFLQVRNPLDTICSLKVGISKNWGHHPRPPDWQDWLDKPLITRCAHHWNYINTVSFDRVKNIAVVTRFEDLILEPLNFAKKICSYAGIDSELNKTSLELWAKRVQNSNNNDFVEAYTSRAYSTDDHRVRVNRWKENMKKEEVEQVVPIIKEAAGNFNYNII